MSAAVPSVVDALTRIDPTTLGDEQPLDLDGNPADPGDIALALAATFPELVAARDILRDRLTFHEIIGGAA